MTIETNSPEETFALGQKLGEQAKAGQIYTLNGDLGVGKTVFTPPLSESSSDAPSDPVSVLPDMESPYPTASQALSQNTRQSSCLHNILPTVPLQPDQHIPVCTYRPDTAASTARFQVIEESLLDHDDSVTVF